MNTIFFFTKLGLFTKLKNNRSYYIYNSMTKNVMQYL